MRVAGIRFINAYPLLYGLQKESAIELILDTPSGCCKRLLEGDVDVALVPVIATQFHPSIRAVKGLGIAARNRTESVYVFSKKPLDQVKSVSMDPASLTSAMLLKIILKEKYGNVPECRIASQNDLFSALRENDAALLIGDEAVLAEKSDYDHYDLATEWHSLTGLSFVFAVWASCRTLLESEKERLKDSYNEAINNWDEVYSQATENLPVDLVFVRRYYNENLHYRLVQPDYEGLLKFFSYAASQQWISGVRKDIWQ